MAIPRIDMGQYLTPWTPMGTGAGIARDKEASRRDAARVREEQRAHLANEDIRNRVQAEVERANGWNEEYKNWMEAVRQYEVGRQQGIESDTDRSDFMTKYAPQFMDEHTREMFNNLLKMRERETYTPPAQGEAAVSRPAPEPPVIEQAQIAEVGVPDMAAMDPEAGMDDPSAEATLEKVVDKIGAVISEATAGAIQEGTPELDTVQNLPAGQFMEQFGQLGITAPPATPRKGVPKVQQAMQGRGTPPARLPTGGPVPAMQPPGMVPVPQTQAPQPQAANPAIIPEEAIAPPGSIDTYTTSDGRKFEFDWGAIRRDTMKSGREIGRKMFANAPDADRAAAAWAEENFGEIALAFFNNKAAALEFTFDKVFNPAANRQVKREGIAVAGQRGTGENKEEDQARMWEKQAEGWMRQNKVFEFQGVVKDLKDGVRMISTDNGTDQFNAIKKMAKAIDGGRLSDKDVELAPGFRSLLDKAANLITTSASGRLSDDMQAQILQSMSGTLTSANQFLAQQQDKMKARVQAAQYPSERRGWTMAYQTAFPEERRVAPRKVKRTDLDDLRGRIRGLQ